MSAFLNSLMKAASGSSTVLPSSPKEMCFTVNPQAGESSFSQWVTAMKMVAQLPGGIPPEFRKRLWLTMAEKHLASKGVDWNRVERTCFSEWAHPEDGELGVQIVKDLHRTGCSLFCGEGGQENQALLKKVLLAYARWNKAVGYCQGFNMLAALILQVTDKSETDALKLMIYLIEGVLPDSYFADSLRGLSVDMAVFRELLRTRLPRLSKHLDLLQNLSKEGTTSYEPPLTNVFTMQWFLTLFCNCLPQPSVLRIWDLILLEGNEILLRTALAIWQTLAEKILRVRSADEFYCIMGILTTELLENNLIDANTLIKAVVSVGPLIELKSLREHYLFNINPLGPIPANLGFAEKQLKIYPKERIALDISTLKKQYMKLRQRQRQAHIIFSAAINRQPPPKAPVAMNHLLLGKSALVPAKRLGPPKGSIPPARVPTTLLWKDTKQPSSSSSSDTELCDDDNPPSECSDDANRKSPVPDLPEDNPKQSDTSNVEEDVQNTPTSLVEIDNIENQKSGDIFETLVSSDFNIEKIADVDSEDDSVDFELFLEDRVKSLKQDGENKRVSLSRRNSERALQIIQENSLILHRILQCQSRLSLSPPATETGCDTEEESNSKKSPCFAADEMEYGSTSRSETTSYNAEEVMSSSKMESYPDISNYSPKTPGDENEYIFPSKYEDILTKSKCLNEKCDDLFNTKKDESKEGDIELPESKTFTNQDELIDLISGFTEFPNSKNNFDSTSSENTLINFDEVIEDDKIRPWLEKIDLNRNTEYLQDSKLMKNDSIPQHTENEDLKSSTSSRYFDDTQATIPDMIVSFSESRKNSEKESNILLSSIDNEWSKKFLSDINKSAGTIESISALTTANYTSKLETPNFERKSLSATNSIEKTEEVNDRRSLSANNLMERTSSPSSRVIDEDIQKEDTKRFRIKSPDTSYDGNVLSPPRSRLSSSNSRDLTSPLNESSISISSRVSSPSPERDSESYRRYSPRRTCNLARDDVKGAFCEDITEMRSKSPKKNFEIDDPRDSSEYRNYRVSKDRIERKLYGDSSESSKSARDSSENLDLAFRGLSASITSPEKRFDNPRDPLGSPDEAHIFFRSPSGNRSTEEQSEIRNQDTRKSYLEQDDFKYRPTSPKFSSTGSYSSRSSPLLRFDERRGSPSPKSPTKVFNPFPIPLSSRQNKEIGVKLGLYKK
ncbi:dentin sialophosphoprotein isoform X2 [Harmonia axyridis]|uniref:dentin sialophosphoprotein isoform X2 n=1 Tax=Harmonia axyridis TaxID=115357 RepID=UPI001E2795BE|nr:dentin sialophosphoprotein isoform X2 [Harmonia axyridis]